MDNANDPELSGKYLGTITADFVKVADTLKEASYQVRSRKFSEYPIFPISKVEQPIGTLLLGREDMGLDWNYYATYLDEFVQRQLLDDAGLKRFQETYKNPDEFACLFVIEPDFTKFVFIPFPAED